MAEDYILDEDDVRIIRNEVIASSGDGLKALQISVSDIRDDAKLQSFLDSDELDYALDHIQGVVSTGERKAAYLVIKVTR